MASTQAEVLAAARVGAAPGMVLVADYQTAGAGRRGRRWESPAGASLIVSVLAKAPNIGLVPMAAGLAARDACDGHAESTGVTLKWPNDLVAPGGAKVGGVLADVVGPTTDTAALVVVGLGINVDWPGDLPDGATDLRRLGAVGVDRRALLDAFLSALDRRLRQEAAALAGDYRAACVTISQEVSVRLAGGGGGDTGVLRGRAADVDDDGSLVVVDLEGKSRQITAGDVVHLRPWRDSP